MKRNASYRNQSHRTRRARIPYNYDPATSSRRRPFSTRDPFSPSFRPIQFNNVFLRWLFGLKDKHCSIPEDADVWEEVPAPPCHRPTPEQTRPPPAIVPTTRTYSGVETHDNSEIVGNQDRPVNTIASSHHLQRLERAPSMDDASMVGSEVSEEVRVGNSAGSPSIVSKVYPRTQRSDFGKDSEMRMASPELVSMPGNAILPSQDVDTRAHGGETYVYSYTKSSGPGTSAPPSLYSIPVTDDDLLYTPVPPTLAQQLLIQPYRHILLRLPSMYFSRVDRLFKDSRVSEDEMTRFIQRYASDDSERGARPWSSRSVSSAINRFKGNWEGFVDQISREWKTLNIVSTLLLTAVMTMFQIDDANKDIVTRSASFTSLICAAWSLVFGGIYLIRFNSMRAMDRACRWAYEAQNSEINIFWNVWVLLALPAVWLAWSLMAFFVAILSYMWTSGSSSDNPQPPSESDDLAPRIVITTLFALGLVYFICVIRTFNSYGRALKLPSQIWMPKPQLTDEEAPNLKPTEHQTEDIQLNKRPAGGRPPKLPSRGIAANIALP